MKYDLRRIMNRAWENYHRNVARTFADCLHRAWLSAKAEPINAERVEKAKQEAGITEECRTWFQWKAAGYEVIHGMKALFQVVLLYGTRGDGATYLGSFFARSQVELQTAE